MKMTGGPRIKQPTRPWQQSLAVCSPFHLPPSPAEHVSEAGVAEFPLVAQTYFCDSRSPIRSPLQPIFSHPLTAPLRSPEFWPAMLPFRSSV